MRHCTKSHNLNYALFRLVLPTLTLYGKHLLKVSYLKRTVRGRKMGRKQVHGFGEHSSALAWCYLSSLLLESSMAPSHPPVPPQVHHPLLQRLGIRGQVRKFMTATLLSSGPCFDYIHLTESWRRIRGPGTGAGNWHCDNRLKVGSSRETTARRPFTGGLVPL